MLGRLSILLAVVILVAVPSAATADRRAERAAARAYADAALRAAPAIETASAQLAAIGDATSCDVAVPAARRAELDSLAGKLATARIIAGFTRTVAPAMRRATRELKATKTHDRALRRGRAAWHDVRRDYAGFAKHPARSVCRQVRAYVDNDFEHTHGTRRGVRAYRRMVGWDTTDIDRRLEAAVDRLVELGIPADEAAKFAGGLG
jgi:hypothetical protein